MVPRGGTQYGMYFMKDTSGLLSCRFPDQRLTREQALKGMTYDAAYAAFAEDAIGSLVPGKKADFVILDRDIMTVPESEILGTKVTATVIDGEVVYGSIL